MFTFGSGQLFGRRTDISNPTPILFGTLQDVTIDFDRSLKELFGQYQFPEAVAPATIKVSGKAKWAKINALAMTNLFFTDSLNSGRLEVTPLGEAANIPATPGPYTITVTHAATFQQDMGVYYTATGVQFVRVASAPAAGQYAVNEATGVYTFAAADQGLGVTTYYTYNVTGSGQQITITNQLQGAGPVFEAVLRNSYPAGSSNEKVEILKLNACIAGKLSKPSKQGDWTIREMDFQAFTDASNVLGTYGFSE